MVIDIIDLTDEEFQNLTSVQLAMVNTAQAEKNEILASAEEKKEKQLKVFLENHTARSSIRKNFNEQVDSEANRQVDIVREDLLYRLAYESLYSDGNELGPYRYPENPNYQLSEPQRFLVVRDYYMHVTSNPQARLQAFGMDKLAVSYLGEYYQTLYDLLASYC